MSARLARLNEMLESGYAQGMALKVFDRVQNVNAGIETLMGLVIGQRVAFERARSARAAFYGWMGLKRPSCYEPILSLLIATAAPLVREYVGADEIGLQLVLTREFSDWCRLHAPWAQHRLISIARTWLVHGMERTLVFPGIGIGPWTQKAFTLLTHPLHTANILLHEDKWVQSRWHQLSSGSKITLRQIERNPKIISISLSKLSLLLWRITKLGIRQLINHKPLSREAFIK
jgi:hypothetical protein